MRDMVIVKIDTSAQGWRGLSRGRHPSEFDPVQLRGGTRVEKEHVRSYAIAKRIAMDHLVEDPSYYRKLARLHLAVARRSPEETGKIGPPRPPKSWMKRCARSVLASGPSRDPRRLCGWVWYHQMGDARREVVLQESRLERVAKRRKKGRSSKRDAASVPAAYGVTRAELVRQTKRLIEEAYRKDPTYVDEVIVAIFGVPVFVWDRATTKQLGKLRRALYAVRMM